MPGEQAKASHIGLPGALPQGRHRDVHHGGATLHHVPPDRQHAAPLGAPASAPAQPPAHGQVPASFYPYSNKSSPPRTYTCEPATAPTQSAHWQVPASFNP